MTQRNKKKSTAPFPILQFHNQFTKIEFWLALVPPMAHCPPIIDRSTRSHQQCHVHGAAKRHQRRQHRSSRRRPRPRPRRRR